MTCDSCTAVKRDRSDLTYNNGDDVSVLTDNGTYFPSPENCPVKRSDPTESPINSSTNSKRSKGHVIHHQTTHTNDANEGSSNKKHSMEPMDDDCTTKQISLQHYEIATSNEQHGTQDWMDDEIIPDSPNDRDDMMSEN